MGIFRWFFGLFRRNRKGWGGFNAVDDMIVTPPKLDD